VESTFFARSAAAYQIGGGWRARSSAQNLKDRFIEIKQKALAGVQPGLIH